MFKSLFVTALMIVSALLLLAPANARSEADFINLTGHFAGDVMSYKAHFFERKDDIGRVERSFELAVNGPPDTKMAVRYEDRDFAIVVTNSEGYGHLYMKASGKALTSRIPAMVKGGIISVDSSKAVMQP